MNSFANGTKEVEEVSFSFLVARATIIGILGVTTVTINCFSWFVFKRMRHMNQVIRLLMMSLTTSDIIFGLVGLIPHSVLSIFGEQPELKSFCLINWTIVYQMHYVDLAFLLFINGERYIACTRPLRYPTIVTTKRTKILIVCFWCVTITLTVFLLTGCTALQFGNDARYDLRYGSCSLYYVLDDVGRLIMTIISVMGYIVPTAVISIMLSRLLYIAKQQRESEIELKESSHTANNTDRRKTFNTKGIKTFLLITLSITIVWLPFLGVTVYEETTNTPVSVYVVFISQVCLFSFASVNVSIYYFRNDEFQKTTKRILKQICARN